MEGLHPLLVRQIQRHLEDDGAESLENLLRAVDGAYRGFDEERSHLERFLDASSQELAECNEETRAVFQLFPDLFFRLDAEGGVLDYSLGFGSGAALLRGRTRVRHFRDLVGGEPGTVLLQTLQSAHDRNAVTSVELEVDVEGLAQTFEATFIPRGPQCLVFFRDVTSRRVAEDRLRRRNEYLSALHETTVDLMHRHSLDALCEGLVHRAARLLDVNNGYLRLFDPVSKLWRLACAMGPVGAYCAPFMEDLGGFTRLVAEAGRTLLVPDYDVWEDRNAAIPPGVFGSLLGAPVVLRGGMKGVLCLLGDAGRFFGEDQIFLVERFSRMAALVIDNVQLEEEARKELEERRRAEQSVRDLNATLERRVADRTAQIEEMNRELEEEIAERLSVENLLQENLVRVQRALEETVNALTVTAEKRDPFTAGHQRMVAQLACAIGGRMGLSPDRQETLRTAGLLHDIGKIAVPIEILSKPGRLSPAEMRLIHPHSTVGYEILGKIPFDGPVAEIVLQHHERLDGSGYPRGARGEDLLLESRILAVADVVEAMASHRPYRPSLGIRAALQEIFDHRGTGFDPAVVDACLDLFRGGFRFQNPS